MTVKRVAVLAIVLDSNALLKNLLKVGFICSLCTAVQVCHVVSNSQVNLVPVFTFELRFSLRLINGVNAQG